MVAEKVCWAPVLTVGFCGKTCTTGGSCGGVYPPPPPALPQDVSNGTKAKQERIARAVSRPVSPRARKPEPSLREQHARAKKVIKALWRVESSGNVPPGPRRVNSLPGAAEFAPF